MALFHLRNAFISRGQGQSVVAAAAYRARERLRDETTGQVKDYTRKTEQPVLFSGIYAPKNAPPWTREQLWNAAERAEDDHNRKSWRVAITAQDIELALMEELTLEQNRRLLQDYIREQFTRHGYAVDANIHGPHADGDQRNIHAHLLITMRTLDAQGFSADKRQMDRKELSQWVDHWRAAWAKTASRHLERAGHPQAAERMAYGHLTLAQQRKIALEKGDHEHAAALAREASQHVGPKATQMEREGKASERGDANRTTATRNRAHRERLGELHRELSQVDGEIATEQAKNAQVYRMADAQGPTVGWWQAARARAAMHPPTPTQAHAQAAGPAPSPKQAKPAPAPTPQPTRPLADAEPRQAPEESLRERLEEQEEEKQEENRQQKGRARPPEPHHERAEKSRVEQRTEQLRQHRGQRRTPPRR